MGGLKVKFATWQILVCRMANFRICRDPKDAADFNIIMPAWCDESPVSLAHTFGL